LVQAAIEAPLFCTLHARHIDCLGPGGLGQDEHARHEIIVPQKDLLAE
jgi:hypothetical protein